MLQTDLRAILAEARDVRTGAQVSPRRFFLLYLLLDAAMRLANYIANLSSADALLPISNPVGMFVTVLVNLLTVVLGAGCCLYCLAIRRGERAEYLTLFDGFSFVGRIILVSILQYSLVVLWSVPGSLVMGLLLGSPFSILAAPLMALPLFVLEHMPPLLAGVIFATLLITLIGAGAGLALGISTVIRKDIRACYAVLFDDRIISSRRQGENQIIFRVDG